jgi:hypothetical protein
MDKATQRVLANAPEFINGLLQIAAEIHTVDDEGRPITNTEALQRLLWKEAMGWREEKRDDRGHLATIDHPPILRVQEFLYSVVIGKPGTALPPASSRPTMSAKDKVSALAVQRMNQMAREAMAPASGKGPPQHKPKAPAPEPSRDEDDADDETSEADADDLI